MVYAVIVILGLIILWLALCLYGARRNIRGCTHQLRRIRTRGKSGRVALSAPGRVSEELLTEINALLEAQECAAAEYQQQEKNLRQQIANVSHDLRTPLTSILGYLQLLEGNTLTAEEQKEYRKIVYGRAKSLQELITSFYELSRLEGGEVPLNRESVDLYGILSELVAEFYNDFTKSGFNMTVELAEGLPRVTADPAGVLRVFTNLIRNALEHGTTQMAIRLYQDRNCVVSTFSNDAEGLTGEDVLHVFDRFYTADKPRTGKSTGLGLAIVKALVRQMGHSVTAELENGIFTVRVCWKLVP
jgi:signal transduction histidine kinase